eukprot:TRINITY_DN4098_c0_g1_i3.p1 TRINITY_DN4098_c0_g1~~TRINITY_DN4098_c0_g1_i3.p1  ORF type:complete len:295 (+),score=96.36 TRINITY_DN4098_c0_g1_i3:21-905(+)
MQKERHNVGVRVSARRAPFDPAPPPPPLTRDPPPVLLPALTDSPKRFAVKDSGKATKPNKKEKAREVREKVDKETARYMKKQHDYQSKLKELKQEKKDLTSKNAELDDAINMLRDELAELTEAQHVNRQLRQVLALARNDLRAMTIGVTRVCENNEKLTEEEARLKTQLDEEDELSIPSDNKLFGVIQQYHVQLAREEESRLRERVKLRDLSDGFLDDTYDDSDFDELDPTMHQGTLASLETEYRRLQEQHYNNTSKYLTKQEGNKQVLSYVKEMLHSFQRSFPEANSMTQGFQ